MKPGLGGFLVRTPAQLGLGGGDTEVHILAPALPSRGVSPCRRETSRVLRSACATGYNSFEVHLRSLSALRRCGHHPPGFPAYSLSVALLTHLRRVCLAPCAGSLLPPGFRPWRAAPDAAWSPGPHTPPATPCSLLWPLLRARRGGAPCPRKLLRGGVWRGGVFCLFFIPRFIP